MSLTALKNSLYLLRASLCVVVIAACQALPSAQESATVAPTVEHDPAFEGPDQIFARQVILFSSLRRGHSTSFAQFSPSQLQRLSKITSSPDWQLTVFEVGGRMLVLFSPSHPLAGFELLLAHDLDRLVLFDLSQKQRHVMPLSRLPDLLDNVPPSHRDDFELDLKPGVPPSPSDRLHMGAIKKRTLLAQLNFRYFPSVDKPMSWPIRIAMRVESPERIMPPAQVHPLLNLALPLLQSWRGRGVLETMAQGCGTPSGWSLVVTNENKASHIPLTIETTVKELGFSRISLERLSTLRPEFPTAPAAMTASLKNGYQIDYAQNLEGLRNSKTSGTLIVNNLTNSLAHIYADGVLLGWVGPGHKMSFQRIPEGFFRIYAISPTGLHSWGPLDSYIPGPVTLR